MNDNRESIRNNIKHIRNLQSTNDIDKYSNIINSDELSILSDLNYNDRQQLDSSHASQ